MKGDSFFDEVRLRESSFCIPLFILLRDEGRVLIAVRRRVHEPLVVIGGGFCNRFELMVEKLFFGFLKFVNHQKTLATWDSIFGYDMHFFLIQFELKNLFIVTLEKNKITSVTSSP